MWESSAPFRFSHSKYLPNHESTWQILLPLSRNELYHASLAKCHPMSFIPISLSNAQYYLISLVGSLAEKPLTTICSFPTRGLHQNNKTIWETEKAPWISFLSRPILLYTNHISEKGLDRFAPFAHAPGDHCRPNSISFEWDQKSGLGLRLVKCMPVVYHTAGPRRTSPTCSLPSLWQQRRIPYLSTQTSLSSFGSYKYVPT